MSLCTHLSHGKASVKNNHEIITHYFKSNWIVKSTRIKFEQIWFHLVSSSVCPCCQIRRRQGPLDGWYKYEFWHLFQCDMYFFQIFTLFVVEVKRLLKNDRRQSYEWEILPYCQLFVDRSHIWLMTVWVLIRLSLLYVFLMFISV